MSVATAYIRKPSENHAISPVLARRLEIIGSSTLFQGLSPAQRMQATLHARSHVYERNEYLFRQGEPASHLLLIDNGSVKLSQFDAHGNDVILSLSGARDTLGVSVLLARNNYASSARAVAKCRAILWERALFESLLSSNAQIRENVDSILLERIQKLGDRFLEIATENVEQRVAHVLLRVLGHMGRNCIPGIEVALSTEELAQLAGTNLLTVSRLVSKWYEEGLVKPRRNTVLVLDPQGLSAACHA
jgi:CRP-like cAMP-binding protein